MKGLLALAAIVGVINVPTALAASDEQTAKDIAGYVIASGLCGLVKDDKSRLECFDKALASLKDEPTQVSSTASTKDMLTTFAPGDFKVVDPEDMHLAPRKFIGKPVEVKNLQCFFADKEDYRCVVGAGLVTAFFVPKIVPDAERDRFENDCGAVKVMLSPKCRRSIRIVPSEFDKDTVNGMTERIVIKANSMELLPPQSKRR